MTTIWLFAHHCVAHPLLFITSDSGWATRFHDWTGDKMSNRCECECTSIYTCETCQLRAALATVKADEQLYIANVTRLEEDCERWLKESEAERAAHAETRKVLELYRSKWKQRGNDLEFVNGTLESTRAELAKAEARVKELETKLDSLR